MFFCASKQNVFFWRRAERQLPAVAFADALMSLDAAASGTECKARHPGLWKRHKACQETEAALPNGGCYFFFRLRRARKHKIIQISTTDLKSPEFVLHCCQNWHPRVLECFYIFGEGTRHHDFKATSQPPSFAELS